MTKQKIPNIRFNNYTDAWEQRKLGEVVDFNVPNNTLSRANLNYDSGIIKNIHYGDILVKFTSVVDVNSSKVPWITDANFDDYKRQLLENGDIIIADTAEDETTGKAIEISGIDSNYAVSGLHTIVGRPKTKFAPGYLGYYLNSPSYRKNILPLMQGIKVLSVSKNNISGTVVKSPNYFDEQTQIGSFFQNFDNLIALHQRKLEELKSFKSTMLSKMFPKHGQTVPEIRLAGFDGEWKTDKLKNRMNISAGGDIDKSRIKTIDKYPVVANALTNKGIVGYYDDYKVKAPAVTVTGRGDVGHAIARHTSFTPIVRLLSLQSNDFDVDFLENMINSIRIYNESTGVPQLTAPQLGNYYIQFPSLDEQRVLGTFFSNLDNLTSSIQSKIEELETLKKKLLQEMFV